MVKNISKHMTFNQKNEDRRKKWVRIAETEKIKKYLNHDLKK
jgi:hypothetical protein